MLSKPFFHWVNFNPTIFFRDDDVKSPHLLYGFRSL